MSIPKKLKLDNMVKQICTHSGSFHADEALAVYMLRLLPEFKDAKILRSRVPTDWDQSDIVVDVSGKYDGVKFFDHHQREFFETFDGEHKTKLSSAGLVYKHFGRDIIKSILGGPSKDDVEILYLKVYKQFIEALDANDNGISKFDAEEANIKPKFSDTAITIPGIISGMNPNWNDDCSAEKFDEQFFKASSFIGGVFVNLVDGYGKSWLPAKELVQEAVKNRKNVDKSGKIIILKQFCPWKEHLFEVEKQLGIKDEIEFVLFEDSSKTWRVSTVPISASSYKFRKGLPEPFRGLRDEELSKKSGIPDCVFIHAAGFIGGTKTKDGALKMAQMSL
ncbi:Myg1p TDEL_0A01550 [Torulaspora delbrueckii]|uniref:MYG1 protein n=1 Tax=Torulaspora delbrueckii TaxID=4950 RepID=G8ZLJ3_TORDE|nr:hypothetical protein TDEL_0A01550 [Torulaspora delbrueckii]CCE89487.1 hypothetical protein TDEL_0A01550 [Torulaspora delbrueckii]